ncbi:hypothetical protein, partial [Klebsiella pneumoniae]|uniref:hypothetical protein n=1 Tax=Klebsiella pneumoniae TaxID=573 RepID=UPI00272F9C3D
ARATFRVSIPIQKEGPVSAALIAQHRLHVKYQVTLIQLHMKDEKNKDQKQHLTQFLQFLTD